MELDKKIVAGICTAVKEYIQIEKATEAAARTQALRPTTNAWTLSGRQEIMRNRQMWQLRIVPG